jgi:hypothetical protein
VLSQHFNSIFKAFCSVASEQNILLLLSTFLKIKYAPRKPQKSTLIGKNQGFVPVRIITEAQATLKGEETGPSFTKETNPTCKGLDNSNRLIVIDKVFRLVLLLPILPEPTGKD